MDHECRWCGFFERREFEEDDETNPESGWCHRFPPPPAPTEVVAEWPEVQFLDWCGEWREAADVAVRAHYAGDVYRTVAELVKRAAEAPAP